VKASARFVSTVNGYGFGRGEVGAATLSASRDAKGIGARSGRSLLALVATLLASAALLLGVAPPLATAATATDSYGYLTSFGDTEAGQFHPAFNILAADQSTGNVFAAEITGPFQGVKVYAPDPTLGGMPLTALNLEGASYYPSAVAIDQTDGALYILDDGLMRIARFVSDGAPVPTYTEDPSFSPPSLPFAALGGLSVDPVTHEVLVAGAETSSVYRYDQTGAFVSSFDGSNTAGGAFGLLGALAIGPDGTTYVVDNRFENAGRGANRVERFSSAGASLSKLPIAAGTPTSIAVNPQSGESVVLVIRQGQFFLEGFDASGQATFSARIPAQIGAASSGLAWDAGTDRIYLGTAQGTVYTFVPAKQPGLDAPVVSQITATGAHLEAQVAPGGEPGEATTARLEYCPASAACASYLVSQSSNPSSPWIALSEHEGLNANGEVTIEGDLAGLPPVSDFLVRVSADRVSADQAHTVAVSGSTPFSTLPVPPETETNEATDVSETDAVLNGTINPVGLPTTYHFEYGTTTAYGSRVPAGIEAVAGGERNDKRFGRTITGLAPATTYHFRLVAQNSAGVSEGADRTFTTAAVGGITHRAYEQVTPVDKGGSAIYQNIGFQAKADGSAISYITQGNSAGAPIASRSMSLRGSDDWTGGIDLDPSLNRPIGGIISTTTLAVSPDFTHTFVATNRKLTSDAVEDGPDRVNLYVVDVATSTHTLVGTALTGLVRFIAYGRANNFVAGARDFSWVVFKSEPALKPGAPENALYRWSATGGLEVMSVLPQGGMTQVAVGNDASPFVRSVSVDGSRIYFVGSGGSEEGLFLREEGRPTKAISVSHIAGDPQTPHPAIPVGVSKDGRYVFFFSRDGVKLTTDALGGEGDMYRYDASDDSLEYLEAAAKASGDPFVKSIAVGEDGQTAYWIGPEGSGTLVWHDGVVKTVAPSFSAESRVGPSPDGRYLAFQEAGGIYLYDAVTDQRHCVSCLSDGSPGGGYLRDVQRYVSNRLEQAVTNSGQVFFTSPARLVAADINGTSDVYEYKDGKNTLISPGNAPFDAIFADISEDGSDVFFTTDQKLVGQDNDKTADLYDARINGGLPKQNTPPPQECLRDDCKATPNVGPELPFGGSEALSGPGNVKGEARKRCAKGTHARKVKGKTRCVKQSKAKKKAKNSKRANTNRRQGR
jgi:hypothetical protein